MAAETKNVRTELKGDLARLQWMFGAVFAGVVGILVRLFLYPPR